MGIATDETQHKNLNTEIGRDEIPCSSEILDQLMDAVISIDNDYRVTYLNKTAAELYDIDRERSIGLKLTDLYEYFWLKPEDAQIADISLAEKGQWRGRNIHVKKNGQKIFVESKVNVLKNASGQKIGMMAFIRDITEYKRKEEELQESRNLSRALSDNVYVLLAHMDNEFTITAVNRAFLASSKLPVSELIGKNYFSVYPDDRTKSIFEQVRRTGELVQYRDFPFEFVNQPERGVTFWDWTLTPVKDETGRVQGFVLSLLETTERKKAQDAMSEAAENYNALFNNKSVGLTYCKTVMNERNEPVDFILLDVNPTYESLTGLRKEDVVGKKITEAIQGFAQSEIDWQNHVAMTGEPAHRELFEPHLKRWYDINVYSPRRGYFVSIFTNISHRKRIEESLQQNESLLHSFFDSPGMFRGIVEVADGADIRYIACNPMAARFLGMPQEAITNKLSSELGEPKETVSFWIRHYEQSRRSGQPVHFEYLDKRRDREIWLSVTVNYLGTESGGRQRFAYIATDITESKKAEVEITRLASFPELNPNPVIEVDFDGVVHYFNPAAESMIPDLKNSGLNHPFLLDLKNVVDALVVQKTSFGRQTKIGEDWFYQRFYLVPQTQSLRIYAVNINELKKAENQLRETTDYLDSLLNYANAPIIVWDPDFRITRFNHAFERLTGLNSNDALGKNLDILFPEDNKEEALEYIHRTLGGAYWESVEIPIKHADGTVRTLLWNSANVFDPHGSRIIATIAQGQDITERKKVVDELRETRDYLENLLDYANAPIIVWDSEFEITRFNHAFERLTGLSSKDAIGKPLEILFPPTQKEEAMNHILDTLKGEYWEAVEIPIMRTDGAVRTALWNSANVCDPNSREIVATIAQGQDITERKKLEEKLKIAERMAGIGETAAMVGHDIRNPLQAILGYCSVAEELLNAETCDEPQREKLMEIFEQVKVQVRYTDKIVSDLRDYSTPVTPVPVKTDLRQLIEESRSLSDIPQTVSFSVNIPKTLHNAKVDPSILKRALVNLITNAVQAMPNGGRLNVKVARRKNPATLVLSVEDTGIGILKKDRPKMFVPLFTTKAKGQGLGLPVCKRLIEAHDGTITFKSHVGKGSQFIIKIPLKKNR